MAGPDAHRAVMLAREKLHRMDRQKLKRYTPYPFQAQFHEAGLLNWQVLLMAANQVGKTRCGGAEVAFHLTGDYPAWWIGRRYTRPIKAWASGTTNDKTRDILQAELCGDPKDPLSFGTGMIPGELIVQTTRKPGVPNAFSAIAVRHISGGNSVLAFKSYEMGKDAFMGEGMDVVWLDEEPPEDIYSQCLARVLRKKGLVLLTFTPENGSTALVASFMNELRPRQAMFNATWDDAPHLDVEARKQILEALPPHERDMRSRGIPILGSGLVFPVEQSRIECDAFEIPDYFARINGLDFGLDHPAAFVSCAWDRETNIFYVCDCFKESNKLIPVVASAIKSRGGGDAPVAWPHDGMRRDSGTGTGIAQQYRTEGVKMLPTWFTNPPTVNQKEGEGGNSVEDGVQAMYTAMEQGNFKVFKHLMPWFQEFRLYHRKDGVIVKILDDLMAATRYAYQSRRFAKSRTMRRRQETALSETNPLENS